MFFNSKIATIYYEAYGPEDAPAIVFSHGVAMSHETFQQQVAALKDTYRVIVWDMPFHGRSSEIDKSLGFSKASSDIIIELLDELKIEKAVFAGLSLGSLVFQHVADKYPERVVALVHISGGSLYPKYSPLLNILKPFIPLSMAVYPEKSLYKAFAKHKALTKETQEDMIRIASNTGKNRITYLTIEMLKDMVAGLPKPPIKPTLFVYGDHDINFIKKMNHKWHGNTPNSQLVEIKNAHHILNQDNPEEFNRVLLSFLQQLEAYKAE